MSQRYLVLGAAREVLGSTTRCGRSNEAEQRPRGVPVSRPEFVLGFEEYFRDGRSVGHVHFEGPVWSEEPSPLRENVKEILRADVFQHMDGNDVCCPTVGQWHGASRRADVKLRRMSIEVDVDRITKGVRARPDLDATRSQVLRSEQSAVPRPQLRSETDRLECMHVQSGPTGCRPEHSHTIPAMRLRIDQRRDRFEGNAGQAS